MTWASALPTWETSRTIGTLYRGDSAWDALWTSWAACSPWRDSLWRSARRGAPTGTVERRRGRAAVLADRGRPNRKRRQYLRRKDAAISRRRRERGRIDWDPHPPEVWTDTRVTR